MNILQLEADVTFSCIETKSTDRGIFLFDRNGGNGWQNGTLSFDELVELEQLTLKIDMILIDIFDNNGHCITDQWLQKLKTKQALMMVSSGRIVSRSLLKRGNCELEAKRRRDPHPQIQRQSHSLVRWPGG